MEEQAPPLTEHPQNISLTSNFKSHRHDFQKEGNYLVCSCGAKKLAMAETKTPGVLRGIKSDGVKYTMRQNRMRYMFPDEWVSMMKHIKNERHAMFFESLLFTGGRTMEVLHLKPSSFDFERGTVNFTTVKQRKAKKQYYATKAGRQFIVSDRYLARMRRFITRNKIEDEQYLFLKNDKLPSNYDFLENTEKKKYYESTKVGYAAMFKRKLKKAGVKNPQELALHNIRKTYGSVMRLFQIEVAEICYRLGNDTDTFMQHYGSSLIHTREEILHWQKIWGPVK